MPHSHTHTHVHTPNPLLTHTAWAQGGTWQGSGGALAAKVSSPSLTHKPEVLSKQMDLPGPLPPPGTGQRLHCGPRTRSSSWFCPLEADQRDISPPESPWTPGLRLSNNFVTSKYFQQSLPKELSNSLKPFEGRCLYYGRVSFWGGSQSYMESK